MSARFVPPFALIVVLGTMGGCDRRPTTRPTERKPASAETAPTPRTTTSAPASASASLPPPQPAIEAGRRVLRLALALDQELAGSRRRETIVFSPLSVFLALELAHLGARGKTRAELGSVLSRELGAVGEDTGAGELLRFLQGQPAITVEIANACWVASGLRLNDAFTKSARSRYLAEVAELDFKNDPGGALGRINSWFEKRTHGLIARVVPQGGVGADTVAVLASAFYFLGPWAEPFEPSKTERGFFSEIGGNRVELPMMHRSSELAYADTDFGPAVLLPYAGRDVSMLVALPRDSNWFERPVPADFVENAVRSVRFRPVVLSLPRFDIKSDVALAPVLSKLGVQAAWSASADFGDMLTGTSSKLSGAFHQARVRVEEKGTEAAAGTALGIVRVGPAPQPVEFNVNRPFLFAIRSHATGAILMWGRVGTIKS